MISLFAPIPLLLFKLKAFEKKSLSWLPIFLAISIYVFYFYDLGSTGKLNASFYTSLIMGNIVYLVLAMIGRRPLKEGVIKAWSIQLGLFAFSGGLITYLHLVLFLWLAFFNWKTERPSNGLLNLGLPLLFGVLSVFTEHYLNGAKSFADLTLVTSNLGVLDVFLVLVATLLISLLLLIGYELKRFTSLDSFDAHARLSYTVLMFLILRDSFSGFSDGLTFVVLILSTLYLLLTQNFLRRTLFLIFAVSFVLNLESFWLVSFLPLSSPAVVSRAMRLLNGLPDIRTAPLFIVSLGVPAIVTSSLQPSGKVICTLLVFSFGKAFVLEKVGTGEKIA